MRTVLGVATAIATAAGAVAVVLAVSGGPPEAPSPSGAPARSDAVTARADPVPARADPVPADAREDCSTRSGASFPGAYTSPDNLVVGPLALVGGAYTDAGTVREYGGNKFPLLVKAGHTVTVRIADDAPRGVGLAYGPLPQGETRLRDTHRSVAFVACRPGGPSGSRADGAEVTFWSGFVLTRAPACIPLEVFVDGAPAPRRVGLGLGRRCRA